ncbi:hypothetical protein GCM10017667_16230 [Streptomyces filamentosus]|uniref:Uncharacterized protein n=1 Tax=Streptomyces filamentosus TaxID=67294 RepID=A0A919BFW7_STRFL|nr:hypothetical protein GCM10017667_16230 [Streptomyces filamentosus]
MSGNFGSRVSAKSIFSVDAGASRQCALCEASTAPLSASATIQDRADSSFGSTGAPVPSFTCVPGSPSSAPPTEDMFAGGFGCAAFLFSSSAFLFSSAVFAGVFAAPPGLTGSSARAGPAPIASGSNRAAATAPAVLFEADTIENVHPRSGDPNPAVPLSHPSPPGRGPRSPHGDAGPMKLSRRASWFLLASGVWSWFI